MPRFEDSGESVTAFVGEDVLVACPRCGGCAVSRGVGPEPGIHSPRRLACPHCAHAADRCLDGLRFDWRAARDPHFELPLWLQAPCCGETLWAYNGAHLDLLAAFVGATLRERTRGAHGWTNASLASRLPAWMKARKHRDEVLRVIAQLRERLG